MKRVFAVKLWGKDQPDDDVCAALDLPAMPYELLDAMDQLRLKDISSLRWKITRYCQSNYVITDGQGTLLELNALAQKLSELDPTQSIAYVGLQEMEFKKYKKSLSVPISRLIDLAYSTHCCRVITEARNADQLGRFYVQNGLIPEAEGFSDTQLDLLNYERIGREKCQIEGGVFVKHIMDQEQMLATLNRCGCVDPDIFISQSNELAQQLRAAKQEKERLLGAEHDDTIPKTQELVEILETMPEFLPVFDGELFRDLVERIVAESSTVLRFRLINGLELTEHIGQEE